MKDLKRYALWALPKGSINRLDEVLVLSCHTEQQCNDVIPIAEKDGYHSFRKLDLTGGFTVDEMLNAIKL